MLKYLGFVSVMYDVNRSFSASDIEYRQRKAARAEAARLAAGPGWPERLIRSLAALTRSHIVSADERSLIGNVNRLSRLSPHLLDDIGLLPKGAGNPLAALRQQVSEIEEVREAAEAREAASVKPARRPAVALRSAGAH